MEDVIEVHTETLFIRVLARNKNKANAQAIIGQAVLRRGVIDHFYIAVPAGRWKDGDTYVF